MKKISDKKHAKYLGGNHEQNPKISDNLAKKSQNPKKNLQ